MKRDRVVLDEREVIEFVLKALLDRFEQFDIPVAIGSFDGVHAHLLIQCPEHNPRIVVGIAKQYATAQLKARIKAHGFAVGPLNLKEGEGIWGKRSHPEPITESSHFKNTFGYIQKHQRRGAIVIVPD